MACLPGALALSCSKWEHPLLYMSSAVREHLLTPPEGRIPTVVHLPQRTCPFLSGSDGVPGAVHAFLLQAHTFSPGGLRRPPALRGPSDSCFRVGLFGAWTRGSIPINLEPPVFRIPLLFTPHPNTFSSASKPNRSAYQPSNHPSNSYHFDLLPIQLSTPLPPNTNRQSSPPFTHPHPPSSC